MIKERNIVSSLMLPVYIAVLAFIAVLSGSMAFIVAGIIYSLIVVIITLMQERKKRYFFFVIVSSFLLFYSVVVVVLHFVCIKHVATDFYLGPDELQFYSTAVKLSTKSYGGIWRTCFTDFRYSDFQLFALWIGTLQKLSGLESFYGLLFQKLNVVFLSSFIPGCVFLLCTTLSSNLKRAYQAALLYGFFAFTFFYSLGLLRDVHIALVYAVGLYIAINGKYKLHNYLLMALLGVIVFFLRPENGLFFLAIAGAWILRSGGRNKIIIGFLSIIALVIVIIQIGGITTIVESMVKTKMTYESRTATLYGNTSSLGVKLMSLPIPLNYIGTTGLSQLVPFPFWSAFKDSNSHVSGWIYIPYAMAGLFWFSVWMRIFRNGATIFKVFKKYMYIVVIALIYVILVASTEINARRLMAVYPILFMVYFYISSYRNINREKEFLYNIGVYCVLILAYMALKF